MGFNMNVFRILADVSHTLSKLILIWAIHSNRSAEGVSLITQVLYLVVFCSRYLDLFWTPPFTVWASWWNFVLKIFYIGSSAYIIFLMTRVFARTREREKAWKLGAYSLGGSVVGAPIFTAIFIKFNHPFIFSEVMWTFSIILESTCILPQLLLLRQTTVPTVIDSFYLVTLGSYRALLILNWFVRGFGPEHNFDPIRTIFGVIQTALYIDFAWVYWSRQRVKLRSGGIVDSEDLSRGWLVSRLLGLAGKSRPGGGVASRDGTWDFDEESLDGDAHGTPGGRAVARDNQNRWGPRGISVSADEGVLDTERSRQAKKGGRRDEEEPLTDPNVFEDDDSDREDTVVGGPTAAAGVGNGSEWRDESRQ